MFEKSFLQSPTNCDAHLAESIFQTRSRAFFKHALECQIAEDYGNTGSLRSVFIVCSIKKRQPGNSRAAVNFSDTL
ncbi:DUF6783 domain-containing protein [Blautia faecis]|uniref:DUF6783 domain-containing protein n=1 Tax=Blautia faecis TaxID=871665 RepID=UPI003A7F15E0